MKPYEIRIHPLRALLRNREQLIQQALDIANEPAFVTATVADWKRARDIFTSAIVEANAIMFEDGTDALYRIEDMAKLDGDLARLGLFLVQPGERVIAWYQLIALIENGRILLHLMYDRYVNEVLTLPVSCLTIETHHVEQLLADLARGKDLARIRKPWHPPALH